MQALYDWDLTDEGGGVFLAHGYVAGHPKPYLPDGLFIHTSPIRQAVVEAGRLLLTTRSGSIYTLYPETICSKNWEHTSVCLTALGVDAGFGEFCLRAKAQADEEREKEAKKLLEPGELLLELLGTSTLNALFRTGEGEIRTARIWTHWGMFQDSILVQAPGAVDFRYFPMDGRLDPYHISDGLHTVKAHNLGGTDVLFGPERSAVRCPAGTLTAIPVVVHPHTG